ncbi:MAG: hypothetical protein M0C28_28585 [Candidatus Moduliflexus flocculans]|nr:hypothetical protein [Candidatus Moduliflexus flocculans]
MDGRRGVVPHVRSRRASLTADLRIIIGQAWMAKVIGMLIPKSLFDKLNESLTRRWASRNMTPEKLGRAYDNAQYCHARITKTRRRRFREISRIPGLRRIAYGCRDRGKAVPLHLDPFQGPCRTDTKEYRGVHNE